VGSNTPSEVLVNIHGPSSKSPLITALSAKISTRQRRHYDHGIAKLFFDVRFAENNTFGGLGGEKLLDGNVVDDGAASGVILHAGILEHQPKSILVRIERNRVRVPTLDVVQCLEVYGLRCRRNRHVDGLQLGARASRTKGDRVNRTFLHRYLLADLSVIAQPHRVSTLRYDEDHPTLFLPRLH